MVQVFITLMELLEAGSVVYGNGVNATQQSLCTFNSSKLNYIK